MSVTTMNAWQLAALEQSLARAIDRGEISADGGGLQTLDDLQRMTAGEVHTIRFDLRKHIAPSALSDAPK